MASAVQIMIDSGFDLDAIEANLASFACSGLGRQQTRHRVTHQQSEIWHIMLRSAATELQPWSRNSQAEECDTLRV